MNTKPKVEDLYYHSIQESNGVEQCYYPSLKEYTNFYRIGETFSQYCIAIFKIKKIRNVQEQNDWRTAHGF